MNRVIEPIETVDGYTDTYELVYGTPEPEHVETVLDGVLDSIAGNESITLSQRYLHSCLESSGAISGRTGVEGFFSAVSDSLKSAWEYVMRLFRSIWGFFFGKGDDTEEAEADKVEKQVAKDKDKLAAAISNPRNPEKTKAVVKGLKKKAKQVIEDPKTTTSDKQEAQEVQEKLNQYAEEADWQPEIHALAERVMKFSKLDRTHMNDLIQRFGEVVVKFFVSGQTEGTGIRNSSSATSLHERMMGELKPALTHMNQVVKKIKSGVSSLFEATELQKVLEECLKAKGDVSKVVRKHKNDIQKEVNTLTAEMNKSTDEVNRSLKDDVEGCKDLMTMINKIGKLQEMVHDSIKAISKANAAMIGL